MNTETQKIRVLAWLGQWRDGIDPKAVTELQDILAASTPEPQYPCAKCGKLRTKAEGGTTFTVCDECWNSPLPPSVDVEREAEIVERVLREMETHYEDYESASIARAAAMRMADALAGAASRPVLTDERLDTIVNDICLKNGEHPTLVQAWIARAVRDACGGEVKLPDFGWLEDAIADALDRSTESKSQYRWLAETIIARIRELNGGAK